MLLLLSFIRAVQFTSRTFVPLRRRGVTHVIQVCRKSVLVDYDVMSSPASADTGRTGNGYFEIYAYEDVAYFHPGSVSVRWCFLSSHCLDLTRNSDDGTCCTIRGRCGRPHKVSNVYWLFQPTGIAYQVPGTASYYNYYTIDQVPVPGTCTRCLVPGTRYQVLVYQVLLIQHE